MEKELTETSFSNNIDFYKNSLLSKSIPDEAGNLR